MFQMKIVFMFLYVHVIRYRGSRTNTYSKFKRQWEKQDLNEQPLRYIR